MLVKSTVDWAAMSTGYPPLTMPSDGAGSSGMTIIPAGGVASVKEKEKKINKAILTLNLCTLNVRMFIMNQINITQTDQNWVKAEMMTVNRAHLYLQWVVSVIECDGATSVWLLNCSRLLHHRDALAALLPSPG